MATYSSILAWRIPWTEEPGGLWSMGLQRVRHDWVPNTHTHTDTCPGSPWNQANWKLRETTQTFIAYLLRPVVASGMSGCLLLTKWLGTFWACSWQNLVFSGTCGQGLGECHCAAHPFGSSSSPLGSRLSSTAVFLGFLWGSPISQLYQGDKLNTIFRLLIPGKLKDAHQGRSEQEIKSEE